MMKNIFSNIKLLALTALTMGFALGAWAGSGNDAEFKYLEPVYKTAEVPSSGIDRWKTNTLEYAYDMTDKHIVTSAVGAVMWGTTSATSWYVVTNGTFQIGGNVTCVGHVNLVLCDGAKLTVTGTETNAAAIATDTSGSFTVYGSTVGNGHLVVTASTAGPDADKPGSGAGIGGGKNVAGKNITINGGFIEATGGQRGPGIGSGGYAGAGDNNIVINGGLVKANCSGEYGAGIGGGTQGYVKGVVINGGTVIATGGKRSAGIGSGAQAKGTSADITINGGYVVATGGNKDDTISAIGQGYAPNSKVSPTASGICVSTAMKILADDNYPPTTEIANAGVDLTSAFAEKRYAIIRMPTEYTDDCLTFSSDGAFTLSATDQKWDGVLWTSTDKATWTVWNAATVAAAQAGGTGDYRLHLRGDIRNTKINDPFSGYYWKLTPAGDNKIACTGNIETLRGATGDAPSPTPMAPFCYANLFRYCASLTSAPTLPATNLSMRCYGCLFLNCTSLTEAPALPAVNLYEWCYEGMFFGCSSLTSAPSVLPAMDLAMACYQDMFNGCTSLPAAPALPATNLAVKCYSSMFTDCTSLTSAPPVLAAMTLTESCYAGMFMGCTSLTAAPALPATNLAFSCYAYMFRFCHSLTSVPPVLPATDLAKCCYLNMFYECTSLTDIPALPATNMAIDCYDGMFSGCTSLTTVPALPIANLETNCCSSMFYACTSLTDIPALPVTVLKQYCYQKMFCDCSNLVINTTGPGRPWSLPAEAEASTNDAPNWGGYPDMYMFTRTGGDVPELPVFGQTYYIASVAAEWSLVRPQTIEHATFELYTNGCAVVGGECTAPSGTLVRVVYKADDGYCFMGGTMATAEYVAWQAVAQVPAEQLPGETLKIADCVTFSSDGAFTLGVEYPPWEGTLWTSTNKTTWAVWNGATVAAAQEGGVGDYRLYVRGDVRNTKISTEYLNQRWTLTPAGENKIALSGNIETLRGATGDAPSPTPMGVSCYRHMFDGAASLSAAPALPATNLAERCYDHMFHDCASLTNAPALPAADLAEFCYANMFQNCTSLPAAPTLSATNLAESCYSGMFFGCTALTSVQPVLPVMDLTKHCYGNMFLDCTSLKAAPALPATNLTSCCYQGMFWGCTSLTNAPVLLATNLADSCYSSMFADCVALTTAPALPATDLTNSCYSSMFLGCTSLTTVPALSATNLAKSCYQAMFQNCTSLLDVPDLPATVLKDGCYAGMFCGCSNLVINTTESAKEWSIPAAAEASTNDAPNWAVYEKTYLGESYYMLAGTGGDAPDVPVIGRTYYIGSAIATVTPQMVAHTTSKVYTNDTVEVVSPCKVPWGTPVKVVYTADEGYFFADGTTVKTNELDTAKNPATADAIEAPFIPAASVTTNGVTAVYATLTDAWNQAIEYRNVDVLIKMLADATVESTLTHGNHGYGGVLTLDLNGYVLAYAGEAYACIVSQSTGPGLNIIDTDTVRRTPRYFTRNANGLWTLSNAKTDLTVSGGLITGGRAGAVSITYGSHAHMISNVNFVGNYSLGDGGAVSVTYGSTEIINSTFLGNVAATNGGAVYASVPCAMTDCRVALNAASELGGGVYMKRSGSLVRTEVVGNQAGTGGGIYLTFQASMCFPAGTRILMADGSEKVIENVAEGDAVATFDHVGGTNSSAAVFYVFSGEGARDAFTLSFASGAKLGIVDRHDLLLETSRKYVTVSSDDARSYLGRRFYNAARGEWDELVDVQAANDGGAYYSIYTRGHGNCVANGMLTVPDDKDAFINVYELDASLKADAAQLAADIATYGLAEPSDYPNIPLDDFADGNIRYARIAIGKGLTTQEEILFWNEFDYGPVVAKKSESSAPRLMMSAPKLTTAAPIPEPSEPYLRVGAGTVVTGNVTTAGADSNVYLKPVAGKDDPVIDILPTASDVDIGVTLATGAGVFGWTNYVNYASAFTSDDANYGVVYTAGNTLELVRFVTVAPPKVSNATYTIFTNGVKVSGTSISIPDFVPVEVVYKANSSYIFTNGKAVFTNAFDTTVNPATVVGDLPTAAFLITNQTTLTKAISKVKDNGNAIWYIGADFTVTKQNTVTNKFKKLTVLGNSHVITADSSSTYAESAFKFSSSPTATENLYIYDLDLVVTNNVRHGIILETENLKPISTTFNNVNIELAHAAAPKKEGVDVDCVAIVGMHSKITFTNACTITVDKWSRSAMDITSTNESVTASLTIGGDDNTFVDKRTPETIALEPLVKTNKLFTGKITTKNIAKAHLTAVSLKNGDGWSLTVPLTPTDIRLKCNVYVADVEIPPTKITSTKSSYLIPSNASPVEIVYTPAAGYRFLNGTTAKTNSVDATANPATVLGDLPPATAFVITNQVTLTKAISAFRKLPDGCEETWYVDADFTVTNKNSVGKAFDRLTILGNNHTITAAGEEYYDYAFAFGARYSECSHKLDVSDLGLVVSNNCGGGIYLQGSTNNVPVDATFDNVDITMSYAAAPKQEGEERLGAPIVNNYSKLSLTNGCSFTADKWSWAAIDATSTTNRDASLTILSDDITFVDNRTRETIAVEPLITQCDGDAGTVTITGVDKTPLKWISLAKNHGYGYVIPLTPPSVANTTNRVYAAGCEIPEPAPYLVPSNGAPVEVVYSPLDGYIFPDGTTAKTNAVDTATATVSGDLPKAGSFIVVSQETLDAAMLALTNAANTSCKGDWYIGADFTVVKQANVQPGKNRGLDLRIRGNGYTITGAHGRDELAYMFYVKSSSTNDAELLVEDLNLVVSNGFRYAFNLQTTAKGVKYKTLQVTLDNVDVTMAHSAAMYDFVKLNYTTGAAIVNNSASLALTNGCSFTANTNCWAAIDLTSAAGWDATLKVLSDDITFVDNRTSEMAAIKALVKVNEEAGGAVNVTGMEKTALAAVTLQDGPGYSYVVSLNDPGSVDHTTYKVYAGEKEIPSPYQLPSNGTSTVVYTADGDYFFVGGLKVVTNKLDTSKNPATVVGELPVVLEPVEYVVPTYKGTDGNPTNGIAYWTTNTLYSYTVVTDQSYWSEGWYAVTNAVTIPDRIECEGAVHLVLCAGGKLTAEFGITVLSDDDASLAIYGQSEGAGRLVATVEEDSKCAAIGGEKNCAGCNITINGGTIVATADDYASAIGGGYSGNGSNITINGGDVTANAGELAAAIGGGQGGKAEDITINGGTVRISCAEALGNISELIGSGELGSVSSGVIISSEAKVLLGLIGPLAPMDFEGSCILLPEKLEKDIVLVTGLSASQPFNFSTFVLTNAVTGAKGTIEVNGTGVVFAERLLGLSHADGKLTLTAVEYSMINPPVEIANTTAKVYTNDVEIAVGDGFAVPVDTPAYVVYETDGDYFFVGGPKVVTNKLDTSKNPATVVGELPVVLEPVEYVVPTYKGTDGNPTNGIAYWTTNKCYNYTKVTSEPTRAGHGWGENGKETWLVVEDSDVVIADYVRCFGHVHLILCDGADLKVTNGIRSDSNALTIYAGPEGTGELTAESKDPAAGIGCGHTGSGNNVTINGGRITATGGKGAAGIGGGYQAHASNIVINAGIVTATGNGDESHRGGAGIGGGAYGAGRDVVINGGTVTATGSLDAAGIGGGCLRNGTSIVINGGTVTATGGSFGAGIGGGQSGTGSQIVIRGGEVLATAGTCAAGIGGGSNVSGVDIAITGGKVQSIGGWLGAGIGGGAGGDGERILIDGCTVTAVGGCLGAGIGGGQWGGASDIAIVDATVFVGTVRQIDGSIVSAADVIGCGHEAEEAAEDVTISETAKIFFNLTGCYDNLGKELIEEIAPMPADVDGFVIMTPELLTANRVLVGGFGGQGLPALPAFALTNSVTEATDELEIDGAETTFARTFCSLTNDNGKLTLVIRKPVLTVTQLPDVANGYAIDADTDGNNGITNYAWCMQKETTTGFVALTNALEAVDDELGLSEYGDIEETAISSYYDNDDEVHYIKLYWLPADNGLGFAGIPRCGKLYFTCASDISGCYEETIGSVSRIGVTDEWVWEAKVADIGIELYALLIAADASFKIDNLRWVADEFVTVAQGPTMTVLPPDVAMKGSNYVCRMDYGHEGFYYTDASDEFTCLGYPIPATPTEIAHTTFEVYTNGVLTTETEPGLWAAWSNETAEVVYVADEGYAFADGSTVKTNVIDTSKNPATVKGEPVVPVAIPADIVIAGEGTLPDPYDGMVRYPSFAEAYTNAIVMWVTNVHVFGLQNIVTNPPQNVAWKLELVDGASISIATIDEGEGMSGELVSMTNLLEAITGEGTIVLSVTNGTPGAAEYKEALEALIGEEKVVVLYSNFEPERKQEENPEGKPVTSQELDVTDKSKVEEDGTIVLPGVETDGKITVDVKEGASNDVVVAGKLVSHEWDVVIVNETTNTLTVGAIETGMNVLITNMTDIGEIVTLENVIAGKNIKIDNNGHLDADVQASQDITIRNSSVHTIVGTYKAGGKIDILGEYGSLSNAVIEATGTLTLTGTNVISGPVDLISNTEINFAANTLTAWSVAGDNHTAMIDFADVSGSTAFGILVDADQATGDCNGAYVIASNATAAASKSFAVNVTNGTLLVSLTPNGGVQYVGAKAFSLTLNAANELVFTVGYGKFTITYDAMNGAWENGAGGTNVETFVNTGYVFPVEPTREHYAFLGWYDGCTNGAPQVTNKQELVRNETHTLYAKWKSETFAPAVTEVIKTVGAGVIVAQNEKPTGALYFPEMNLGGSNGVANVAIGAQAFLKNTGLTSVALPTFVTNVGDYAFANASKISEVTFVQPRDPTTAAKTTLTIGKGAFAGLSLTRLVLPAYVASIGEKAFMGNTRLADVTIMGPTAIDWSGRPFLNCGTMAPGGKVKLHLSYDVATNKTYAAALWEYVKDSANNVEIVLNPYGSVKVVGSGSDYVEFEAVIDTPWPTIGTESVKVLTTTDLNGVDLEKAWATLEVTSVTPVGGKSNTYRATFADQGGSTRFYRVVIVMPEGN